MASAAGRLSQGFITSIAVLWRGAPCHLNLPEGRDDEGDDEGGRCRRCRSTRAW